METEYLPPESYSMAQQPVMAGHSTEGALRFQLEIEQELNTLKHNLSGEVLEIVDGTAMWVKPPNVLPMINEAGVNSLLSTLRPLLSKIITLSNLDEKQIESMVSVYGKNIIATLQQNWKVYDIKDDTAASLILHTLVDTYYANLCKAQNAKYLKFLSSTTSIQESSNVSQLQQGQLQQQQEGNILGRLFGKKRR